MTSRKFRIEKQTPTFPRYVDVIVLFFCDICDMRKTQVFFFDISIFSGDRKEDRVRLLIDVSPFDIIKFSSIFFLSLRRVALFLFSVICSKPSQ